MLNKKPVHFREVDAGDYPALLSCPFCREQDFDLVGLKGHLEHGDCEPFNALESTRRIF